MTTVSSSAPVGRKLLDEVGRLVVSAETWCARRSLCTTVAAGLGLVAAWAFGAAAAGALLVGPGELAATLTVSVVAAVLANRLCARLWRAPTRDEAALVTGLIVFLVAWPGLDPITLAAAAVSAAAAILAKYALVIRGRRLLNPAAAGLVVSGLLGLGSGSWWVATPVLLAPVVVAGVVTVRRTGTTWAAGGALGAGTVGVSLALTAAGSGPAAAAVAAVGSYPVVFLSVFMMTDPQVLPAGHRAQLVTGLTGGVLLAVVAGAGLAGGSVPGGPAWAVLGANIVSWILRRHESGATRARVTDVTRTGTNIVIATLMTDRPVPYAPGQYVELTAPLGPRVTRGSRRAFSPIDGATGPLGRGLRIAFRETAPVSPFKDYLTRVDAPEGLRVEGARGTLVLPPDPDIPLILVAVGIGVTPFVSYANALRSRGEHRDVVLVHCVRTVEDLFAVEALAWFDAVAVSAGSSGSTPPGWRRLTAVRLGPEELLRICPDVRRRQAYVTGPPAAVAEIRRALRTVGVRRIRTEGIS